MPNGALDVPALAVAGPTAAVAAPAFPVAFINFFRGILGIGSGDPEGGRKRQAAFIAEHGIEAFREAIPGAITGPFSEISGRPRIPLPEEGGPPLVTERFQELPGPFVDPGLGIMPFELRGIPEPEFVPFQPRPIPEPDVLEEAMAVDAPLLSGVGGLPAIFQRTTPIIGGVLGGLAQDLISGFLRAPQELGTAQIPARVAQAGRLCPPERPSTQILRRIFQNTGVRIKLTSAKALARQLGLEHAAQCLGVTVAQLCTLVITPSPRRRRGISGSDIRIVKRTARRFQSLQEDLSGLVSKRRAAPRRRPRHVHAIQHTAPAGG